MRTINPPNVFQLPTPNCQHQTSGIQNPAVITQLPPPPPSQVSRTVDVYNPDDESVMQGPPLPRAHVGGCAVQHAGRLWLVGGAGEDGAPSSHFYSIPFQ